MFAVTCSRKPYRKNRWGFSIFDSEKIGGSPGSGERDCYKGGGERGVRVHYDGGTPVRTDSLVVSDILAGHCDNMADRLCLICQLIDTQFFKLFKKLFAE